MWVLLIFTLAISTCTITPEARTVKIHNPLLAFGGHEFEILDAAVAPSHADYSNFSFETREWELPTPPLAFGVSQFELSGTLAVPTPSHACGPVSKNMSGFIALVDSDRCAPFVKAQNCFNAGAIGVVIRGYRDTFGLLHFYRSPGQKSLPIPVVELWGGLKPPEGAIGGDNVTLVPGPNPIAEFGEGPWTFYTIFYGLFVTVTLCMVFKKIKAFRHGKYDVLPYLTMLLITVTCLLRIPILIDPTGMRGIYNWGIVEAFMTIDFSFAIVSAFIVAFHWAALVREIEERDGSQTRLKIGGTVLSILLLAVEVSTSILRGLYMPAMPFLLSKVALYCIMGFTIGGYFFKSGYSIIKLGSGGAKKIPAAMKKRAYCGLGVATCLIILPIAALLVATPMYDSPGGYFMLRFLVSFLLNTATLLLLFIFESRRTNTTSKMVSWTKTSQGGSTSDGDVETDFESSSE